MIGLKSSLLFSRIVAIFSIALCAVSIRAHAQNSSQKTDPNALEQVERARIEGERKALIQNLELQRQACYQKVAVTPCLNDARDEFNEKTRDLKRQEVALNDMRRKRAAAQRLADVDERNSPQAQLERTERRGRAMEASARREQERQQRKADRAAAPASAPALGGAQRRELVAPTPAGKPRAAEPRSDGDQTAADRAARAQANRLQAEAREKAAQERKAKAKESEAARAKPPAAPLPIPN